MSSCDQQRVWLETYAGNVIVSSGGWGGATSHIDVGQIVAAEREVRDAVGICKLVIHDQREAVGIHRVDVSDAINYSRGSIATNTIGLVLGNAGIRGGCIIDTEPNNIKPAIARNGGAEADVVGATANVIARRG